MGSGSSELGMKIRILDGFIRAQQWRKRARHAQARFGGGHPQPALFYPTIRVPLQATQAEAKRANAKQ
jgi:hypothetical protein